MARRDILLYEDGGRWLIEAREGGSEGSHQRWEFEDEDAALDGVRALLDDETDGWRALTPSPPRRA